MLDFTFNVVDNAKLDLILKEMETMSAAFDRLKAEVTETSGKVDSVLTLVEGLAQFIRDNAEDPAALNAMADELDAKQSQIQGAIDANPVPGQP